MRMIAKMKSVGTHWRNKNNNNFEKNDETIVFKDTEHQITKDRDH